MSVIQAIVLGFVQGITEFIPVSSSGHLILADKFFGLNSSFEFDALLNIGTLAALLVYFRVYLYKLALDLIKNKQWAVIRNLTISTLPAAAAGYLLADWLAAGNLRSAWIVAATLFIGGLFMVLESKFNPAREIKNLAKISPAKALGIGAAQALALMPGTSRSGATILAGRFAGLTRRGAAKYSFLLAIPIISGALFKTIQDISPQYYHENTLVIVVGIVTAFITGSLAISLMLKFLQNHNLNAFGYYRIALSALILLILIA